jgi:glycosyltransferase involved in cell wall biosynthesis
MSTLSIAVLTLRRPDEVLRCLESIARSLAVPLPEPWQLVEVLIVDNDPDGSARDVVTRPEAGHGLPPVRYIHEACGGVAPARNRALDEARGSTLVFIDDDEVADPGWPHGILETMTQTGAAMVGGPVLTRFTVDPPGWITDGRFFDRENRAHRSRSRWLRSGNVAIDLDQIQSVDLRFDPKYRHGEDAAFSMEGAKKGLDLRWSAHGSVTEFVGPERLSMRWRMQRERISHRAWATTTMDLQHSLPAAVKILVRGVQLLLRGVIRVVGGVATGRTHLTVAGLSDGAALVGRVEAVVDHVRSRRAS